MGDGARRGPLREATIVVVGGGIVGCCVAYRLAQAGAAVTVLESVAAASASDSSFAWTNCYAKYPEQYARWNAEGMNGHWLLQHECGGDWYHPVGGLRWAPAGDPTAAELVSAVRQMSRWGATVEEIDPARVDEVEAEVSVDPSRVEVVYRCPDEGWIDTHRMRAGVLGTMTSRFGGVHLRDRVTRIEPGAVAKVTTASGRVLEADVVVNAGGAGAGAVAELAGTTLPVGAQTSSLVVTEPVAVRLAHVVRSGPTWLRQDGHGRFLFGSSTLPPRTDLAEHRAEVAAAQSVAGALVPALGAAAVSHVTVGSQPVPGDNFPIVGFDPVAEGLLHVVSRSGVSLAPRLARAVLSLLLDVDDAFVATLGPERFVSGAPRVIGPAAEE